MEDDTGPIRWFHKLRNVLCKKMRAELLPDTVPYEAGMLQEVFVSFQIRCVPRLS